MPIETVSVTSEYPQNGGSVCCCYDYRVDVQLQNCVVHCVLKVIGCVMGGASHAKQEYLQDGGCGKKTDGLYTVYWHLIHINILLYFDQYQVGAVRVIYLGACVRIYTDTCTMWDYFQAVIKKCHNSHYLVLIIERSVRFEVNSDVNVHLGNAPLGSRPGTRKCSSTHAQWPRDHIDVTANLK